MEPLVISLEEVIENIVQFNKDLEQETDIITQLRQFKHWYYVPALDLFGPSKYIGYRKMNTDNYARGYNKTGVDTEKVLKQWFIKLSNSSEKGIKLMKQLKKLLDLYNKEPNAVVAVHILQNGIKVKID